MSGPDRGAIMRTVPIFIALVSFLGSAGQAFPATTETIVLIRHGEKPPGGEGRLDCHGLNRANALPAALTKQFGRFDAIFAPDPDQMKKDDGVKYRYLRPLETVTPLSKATGTAVDTRFGYKETGDLRRELLSPHYRGATLLVAWEHKKLVKLARDLIEHGGGDPGLVGKWSGRDFDSIYVIRIVRDGGVTSASFGRSSEGLNAEGSADCR